MGFKDWPGWSKGGVVGLIFSIILGIIFGALNYCPSPLLPTGAQICNILFSYFMFKTILIYSLIPLILIGALIGFIISKIRKK